MKKRLLSIGLAVIFSLGGITNVFATSDTSYSTENGNLLISENEGSLISENEDSLISENEISIFGLAEDSFIVDPMTQGYSRPIDGQGKYGRITISSNGTYGWATVEVNSNGTWRTPQSGDPDFAFLYLPNGGSATTNYYMSKGYQYRLKVYAQSEPVNGYIRAYD